jgi:hypothetical protein
LNKGFSVEARRKMATLLTEKADAPEKRSDRYENPGQRESFSFYP